MSSKDRGMYEEGLLFRTIEDVLLELLQMSMSISTSPTPLADKEIEDVEGRMREIERVLIHHLSDHQVQILLSRRYMYLYVQMKEEGEHDRKVHLGYMDGLAGGRRPCQVLSPRNQMWMLEDIVIITIG
jgi:hypothetical protein